MPGALAATRDTQPRQDRPLWELGLCCPGLTGHKAALLRGEPGRPFSPALFLSSSLPEHCGEKEIQSL